MINDSMGSDSDGEWEQQQQQQQYNRHGGSHQQQLGGVQQRDLDNADDDPKRSGKSTRHDQSTCK